MPTKAPESYDEMIKILKEVPDGLIWFVVLIIFQCILKK